jgi:hypothetical protein
MQSGNGYEVGITGISHLGFYCTEGKHFSTVQVHTSVLANFTKFR